MNFLTSPILKMIQMNLFTKQTHRLRKQTYAYQRGELGGEEWIVSELSIYQLIYLSIDLFIGLSIRIDKLKFQRDCLAKDKGTMWLAQQWSVAPAHSVELSSLFVLSLNQGFILTDHIPTF